MTLVHKLPSVLPGPMRSVLIQHRSLLKFLIVGGVCFVVTVLINYGLKLTVLHGKPVTALVIATVIATIVSYVLNREWSFRLRGGRERRHEAALFFTVSAVAVGLNAVPLYISRYLLGLQVPVVSVLTQELSDFISSIIIGTLIAMVFRWWALKKWVFPQEIERRRRSELLKK
ncbi:GtrA family protein [Amycolatopsis cynarae]|uniref:GtrA family protein n=1 Tax=Amycolatopsis cynarae TaxID=2995223 RepID=A0ABY7B6B6_9PSEU|nr:GtrA family protein [Amycolatopsis sp. HUAS 11-8]WAL67701.1 GtrA family protein [Amycolatopsis sp. HUAS 11-8]